MSSSKYLLSEHEPVHKMYNAQSDAARHQGAPKKEEKKTTYLPAYMILFLRFFESSRSDFRKHFYGVFGLIMQRNGQKRD
jgi:hypothetical protein